jgi:outer membrane receptor protein involved in Fe transport
MDSELVFTGDAGTTEPSRPSRRQGVEWSARWQPLRWLLFDLDVSVSKARFTSPDPGDPTLGSRIPGSIGSAVSAGASVHELGPWSASLFLRYFGPRPLVEDASVRSSASTILNAQASYRAAGWLRLTLDVFNVLGSRVDDIAYYYSSLTQAERQAGQTGVAGIHFHPAERRSLRLTCALEY